MTQTQKATKTVSAVRKPYDSVPQLVSKITVDINTSRLPEKTKNLLWKEMLRASDADDRLELVKVLRSVRNLNRRNAQMSGLRTKWSEARKAAEAFVRSENAQGHKGQSLFDLALRSSFVEIQDRINSFLTSREKIGDLEQDIADLKFQVDNFVFDGSFCRTCGEPMLDTKWRYCQKCYVQAHPRTNNAASVSPKRKIKKPGSASRRKTGPKPVKVVEKEKKQKK